MGKCKHANLDGKPFLLNEGLFDEAAGKNKLPGELSGCICTFRDFVPAFGDKATPEIEALLKNATRKKKINVGVFAHTALLYFAFDKDWFYSYILLHGKRV